MKEKNDKGVNCMVSNIHSMGLFGMDAFPVEVEADLSSGLPAFEIVGLPDASVRESRDRVRSSIRNSGFDFPVCRITVNLAPADMKKEGSLYDLPLLVSVLSAGGQIHADQMCIRDSPLFIPRRNSTPPTLIPRFSCPCQ